MKRGDSKAIITSLLAVILPFLSVAGPSIAAEALQWAPSGLSGLYVNSLAVNPANPTVVYAAVGDGISGWGIYKTTTSGESWAEVYGGFPHYTLAIDPINPDTVYAGEAYEPLKTINGGTTWVKLQSIGANYHTAIAIDPTNTATVYVGESFGWGVYKTITGGAAFTQVLSSTYVTALAVNPITTSVVYAGAQDGYGQGGGVYKTSSGGAGWTKVMTHARVNAIAIDRLNPNRIYAATEGSGIFKSVDGGTNWASANTGLTHTIVRVLAIDPVDPNVIYAGTWEGGVFKSTDGGTSWTSMNTGLTNTYVLSLAIDPSDRSVLYAGTEGDGVFKFAALPTYALSVTRSGAGSGTVTSNPPGISCGADCTENYASGTSVTLSATPANGSVFSGWSGGGCSGTGTCTVTMSQAQSVSATFTFSQTSAPGVSLSASTISFGDQNTGTTSIAQSVTLTNSGNASLNITSISVTGTNAAEFAAPSTSCLSSLAAGASCAINVTFSPTSAGAKSASVSISTNASGSPHMVGLSGIGVAAAVIPTSLSIEGAAIVQEGGTATLRALVTYSDNTTRAVSPTWTSSNPAAASVGTGGALIVGQVSADTQVTLTASYTENGVTVTKTFALTVTDVAIALSYVVINGVSVVTGGQSTTLTATAVYTDGSTKTVSPAWTTSDPSIATVSATGVVTTGQVSANTTVLITAIYSEGTVSKNALFNLTVGPAGPCSATPSVAAGYSHTVALRKDCTVWSWGWSVLGQVGVGSTRTRSTPLQVARLSAITAIASGTAHILALRNDGTVWAWGHNGQGGLGDGTTNDAYTPVQVAGITNVAAIAGGLLHSLALKSDGTVWSWGSNAQGQLGDGGGVLVRLTPAQVPGLAEVSAIAANLNYSLALKSDGTVWAWGDQGVVGASSTPRQISQLSGVRALAAGWEYVLALKTDGTVWAWGSNAQGQLGDGTRLDRSTPAQIAGLSEIRAIGAGFNHGVAIGTDGTLWSWGGNAQGQHGNGGTDPLLTPQPVPGMSNTLSAAVGNDYTVILKGDGSVWGAGYNWLGQLGDGSFVRNNRFSPVQDADTTSFFDLAPDLIKDPVPADQVPKFFMQSEKSGDEALTALGRLSSISLSSRIRRSGGSFAADIGTYQLFVAILVPAGTAGAPASADTLYLKTSAAIWQAYAGGALPAYLANVAASQVDATALSILAATDLTGLSGAQFYVGYGTSDTEMMAAGRYRLMYQVP